MAKSKKESNTLYIKNMVCRRCLNTVRRIFEHAGVDIENVQLGEVLVKDTPNDIQKNKIAADLHEEGFELLDDKTSRLVSQIKSLIIEEIHLGKEKKPEAMNFSTFISKSLGHEYSYLSKLFSTVAGVTIEKYIIAQKIERAKELLSYEEMSVSEIAWQLGYSSSQHLSSQFRNVTGISPLEFRRSHTHDRKHLDHV